MLDFFVFSSRPRDIRANEKCNKLAEKKRAITLKDKIEESIKIIGDQDRLLEAATEEAEDLGVYLFRDSFSFPIIF